MCHQSSLRGLATQQQMLCPGIMALFYALVPQASGCSVPPGVVDLLVARRPDWESQAWTDLLTRSLAEGSRTLH